MILSQTTQLCLLLSQHELSSSPVIAMHGWSWYHYSLPWSSSTHQNNEHQTYLSHGCNAEFPQQHCITGSHPFLSLHGHALPLIPHVYDYGYIMIHAVVTHKQWQWDKIRYAADQHGTARPQSSRDKMFQGCEGVSSSHKVCEALANLWCWKFMRGEDQVRQARLVGCQLYYSI